MFVQAHEKCTRRIHDCKIEEFRQIKILQKYFKTCITCSLEVKHHFVIDFRSKSQFSRILRNFQKKSWKHMQCFDFTFGNFDHNF